MVLTVIITAVFGLSLLAVFWTYFGYYLLLQLLAAFFSRPVLRREHYPPVSLVITAHNEEGQIAKKIENALAQTYPKDKLEIIVVSDASTDRTVEIASGFTDKGVRVIAIPERLGKHYAQGKGIEEANGEIVVLTDATTFLKDDAVEKIIQNFADPSVGVVSGIDKTLAVGEIPPGEGAYVRYEMKLRRLESAVNSLVGASGSFYALRKRLAKPWYSFMSSDFYMPTLARKRGFRTVLDERAIGYYRVVDNPDAEFKRKVRTVVHGIDVLFEFKEILNVFRYGFFSFQMFSHKLLRWLAPYFLLIAFLTNVMLLPHCLVFHLLLALQIAFYLAALFGHWSVLRKVALFRWPHFFVVANAAVLVAWKDYLKGERYVTWQSTKR